MMTRDQALERLRTTGILSDKPRPKRFINPAHAKAPETVGVATVALDNKKSTAPRHLAPASVQVVLP